MNFNIDSAIFISFLVFNLAVGLFYSRGIKNIKEYAIGNRGFSTGAISQPLRRLGLVKEFYLKP